MPTLCVQKEKLKISKKVNKSTVLAERPGRRPNIAAPSWCCYDVQMLSLVVNGIVDHTAVGVFILIFHLQR